MELRQVRDDDPGEPVPGREVVLEAVDDPADLDTPGQPCEAARDEHHEDDHPADVDAGVARGAGVVADQSDLVARARALEQEPDQERCRDRDEEARWTVRPPNSLLTLR